MLGYKKDVKVILVEPSQEGNIGAIARSISNFDAAGLILVNPQIEISDTAYRRASHAKDVLENALIYPSLEKALIGIDYTVATTARLARYRNVQRTAVSPRKMANILESVTGTVGFLFGHISFRGSRTGRSIELVKNSDKLFDSCSFLRFLPTKKLEFSYPFSPNIRV